MIEVFHRGQTDGAEDSLIKGALRVTFYFGRALVLHVNQYAAAIVAEAAHTSYNCFPHRHVLSPAGVMGFLNPSLVAIMPKLRSFPPFIPYLRND
jgi:hypothetical protein